MSKASLTPTYLKDYQPPHYFVQSIDLAIDLYETHATVSSALAINANNHDGTQHLLMLDGEGLELINIALNGQLLSPDEYELKGSQLILPPIGRECLVQTQVKIKPQENTRLMGLYKSKENFCTQCEANGFRRITYFVDRPDNLTVFTTRISADANAYPHLLSNGNLIEGGELNEGRHFAVWHDPHPKSSHLFAMVAGDFDLLEDNFTTRSGRDIALCLYVEKGFLDQCAYAMQSVKDAMRWDEDAYGLEYDLDLFMVVAVSDFNMGAMENKGLNIFNTKYILANQESATDTDFINVKRVVGHEYFHNWSGNRVGCRDWFQLSLKEGFTVFREQSFIAGLTSPAVRRIEDINMLRTHQFSEDAGPMSHPVRPASYIEMNNFYTLTVYEKGAEVIRMQHTLLGDKKYRQATQIYFQRFDGQSVTTDDFVDVMQEVGEINLSQFRLWYSQSGTPELSVSDHYDEASKTYTLTVKQQTKPTADQSEKENLHIPLRLGLLSNSGEELALKLAEDEQLVGNQDVLNITKSEQTFTFVDISEKPIPSLLRGLSAPVKLQFDYTSSQLNTLLKHDNDAFCRWDAGQRLAVRQLQALIHSVQSGDALEIDPDFIKIFCELLLDESPDREFLALLLQLPSEQYLADLMEVVDPLAIHKAHQHLEEQLAQHCRDDLLACYKAHHDTEGYQLDNTAIGRRALANVCVSYLARASEDEEVLKLLKQHYHEASNMTDRLGAFKALVGRDTPVRERVIEDFYEHFKQDELVLDKWFAAQAATDLPGALERVNKLLDHPKFSLKNPNKVRAVITTFAKANPAHFHAKDGSAYAFLADHVLELEKLNPQIAARLVEPLTHWEKMVQPQQAKMHEQLKRVQENISSKDLQEIVGKALV